MNPAPNDRRKLRFLLPLIAAGFSEYSHPHSIRSTTTDSIQLAGLSGWHGYFYRPPVTAKLSERQLTVARRP